MNELTVIVPSRGRPQNVRAYLEAWQSTSRGLANLTVAVDDDDPTLDEYRADHNGSYELIVGERLRLGPTLNKLALAAAKTSKAVGFTGDDHRFRTDAWDEKVVGRMNSMSGKAIVYGDDLIQGPNLPTAVFMTSNIINVLGYMSPPKLIHLFIDNAWKSLGENAGCLNYMPNVIVEHMHPLVGKAVSDAGYAEVNSGAMYENDYHAYQQWLKTDAEQAYRLIREL